MTLPEGREGGLPLQTSHVTVEVVLVSGDGARIGVLPESVIAPPSGQSANTASITSDPQRASRSESGVVTGASTPPVSGGVDDGVATDTGMVSVGEVADPINHRGSAQAIASRAIGIICPINDESSVHGCDEVENTIHTFDVKCTWESGAIASPTSTVGGKVGGLSGTRGPIRESKVVATTDETGPGGTGVLRGEVRVLVA